MERFTSFDGTEIAYQRWGPGTAAVPVFLHHGFIADGNLNFAATGIVDALTAAGHDLVAIDARGHGASAKPSDPAAYGEANMARDLEALFDLVGADQVDLVGYSMGAIVALIAASEDTRIRRLVVGGVGSAVVELGGVDTRVIPNEALVDALSADDPGRISHPDAVGFRQFADAIGADRMALAAQASVVHASPIALDRITAPTLVLAGDVDELASRPGVLADAIPDAKLEVVEGDHMAAVAQPRLREAIVEFLA